MLVLLLMTSFLSLMTPTMGSDDFPFEAKMRTLGTDVKEHYHGVIDGMVTGKQNVTACLRHLELALVDGGQETKILLDATGKPASGLLEGNFAWLGDYRQCTDAENLHYCLLSASIKTGSQGTSTRVSGKVMWGLCLPTECQDQDVKYIVRFIVGELGLQEYLTGLQAHCDSPRPSLANWSFICTLVFFAIMCLVSVSAAFYEHRMRRNCDGANPERVQVSVYQTIADHNAPKETDGLLNPPDNTNRKKLVNTEKLEKDLSIWKRVFLCFSYNRTLSQIFRTEIADGDIMCLNGMRVISMFWIILGHTASFQQKSGAMGNILWAYTEAVHWFTSQALINAYPALDTFFFIGGLLVAYTGFKYMERLNGKVNWAWALFHRYLRLTPALGSLMLFYTNVFPYLGSGPFWYQRVMDCQGCYEWWWTNLLYINNFVPANPSAGCVSWTWYLGTDMQLFIFGTIVIVLLWRSRIIGGIVVILASVASLIVRIVIFIEKDYQATQVYNTIVNASDGLFAFSVKPYTCASAYLIGVVMGYFLHVIRYREPIKLHPILALVGWIVAWTIGMAVVYGLYGTFTTPDKIFVPLSKTANVIYGSLCSLAWSLALAWVVFACEMGYGGVINTFLSWKFWIPLSRLTYCAYLLHPSVIYLYTGTETTLFHPTVINQSYLFAGFVVLSYTAALILSALVEMPVCNLQKMLGKRQR